MRKHLAVWSLLTVATGTVAAQGAWHPEIGVQGGYARTKQSGTGQSDFLDFTDAPGGVFLSGVVTYGALYGIVPISRKLALEPSFGASQITAPGGSVTTARLGVRANYAFGAHVYAAAGGTMGFVESLGTSETQLGFQAAVGYRTPLSGTLNGRVEALYATTQKTDGIAPINLYALLLGVSARLDARAPARGGGSAPGAWRPMFGIQGGYSRTHIVGGGGDLSALSLPGLGGSVLSGAGAPFLGPTTLFAIFPVGRKFALEPGLDVHRTQQGGQTVASVNVIARLNYALVGGMYAGAGFNLSHIHVTGLDTGTLGGATLAWGYRFPLAGALGGRSELSYTMMEADPGLGVPAQNILGVLFGLTMAIK